MTGLMTHDNVGMGISNTSEPIVGSDGPDVATDRTKVDGEIFVDQCDICSYFENKQQKVKWCKWTEGKETHSAILCKPCFILIPGGNDE